MTADRDVAKLAFQDGRTADLYFCRDDCDRKDRAVRKERCSDCERATRQDTVGATAFRIWKG